MPRRKNIRRQARVRINRPDMGDRQPAPARDTTQADAVLSEPKPLEDILPVQPAYGMAADAWLYVHNNLKDHRDRRRNYELYEQMDDEDPEVSAALDIYADNSTQVGVTKSDAHRGMDNIIQVRTTNDNLRQFLEDVRNRLRLDNRAWALARDLAKMGDVFEEVVVRQDLQIDRLKQLAAKSMVRNEDAYGVLDQERAFLQTDETGERVLATFEPWEVVHFRLTHRNEHKYGTSILHPIRRVYKQLSLIEDSMVVARLTRATSKLVFTIDTGGLPGTQAIEYVNKVKDQHRKRRLFDPRTGKLRTEINPLQAEEDIFIGSGKGGQTKVDQLYGDLNIGNLTDVEYFQNKKLGGMHIPKSYIGVERDVNSRATLTNQDIQFARSVRRIQLAMRFGYQEIFDLALLLEAPGTLRNEVLNAKYRIVLPAMQTIDEMREWEVMRVQHEIARIAVQELYLDPVRVLSAILGYSEDEAKAAFLGTKSPFVELGANKNSTKSANAQLDKRFARQTESVEAAVRKHWRTILDAVATEDRSGAQVIEDLRMMTDWKLELLQDEWDA